jgi:hypothetical protein
LRAFPQGEQVNIAIIIGISEYSPQPMPASANDAARMQKLLEASGKYQHFLTVTDNTNAASVKDRVRTFLRSYEGQAVEEVFFYYSGHGVYDGDEHEFFMLCSDYDKNRRSTTSLQNSDIDNFIRALSPKLTVKVLDACFSGFRYVKSDPYEIAGEQPKEKTLGDLIFMASSHDNQTSSMMLTDSYFTAKFIEGALFLKVGEDVLYRDIHGYIADEFKNMRKQRPFFTLQGTGTEVFAKYTEQMKALKDEWYPEENKELKAEDQAEGQDAAQAEQPADAGDKVLNEVVLAVENQDKQFVDEAKIIKAIEDVKKAISEYQIADEVVEKLYAVTAKWDRKFGHLEKSESLIDMAAEQKWPQEYLIEFKMKPMKVRVPKRNITSQMRFMAGQESDADYMWEMEDMPYGIKPLHELPCEVIWIEYWPKGHPSLSPFFAIAALVHSETHLLAVWGSGMMIKDGWRHFAIDWSKVEWADYRLTWDFAIEDSKRVWESFVTVLEREIREYLHGIAKLPPPPEE